MNTIKTKTVMNTGKYLVFCKVYFACKFKMLRLIMGIIGTVSLIASLFCFYHVSNRLISFVLLWLGVFCFAYPRLMHRSTYKELKKRSQVFRFVFEEEKMTVKSEIDNLEYKYSDISEVVETSGSFVLICENDRGLLVDKSLLEDEEISTVRDLFKRNTKYRRKK